jgi:transposase
MPAKQHVIKLTPQERAELEEVSQSNRRSVREKTRARLLLGSDTGVPREEGGSQSDLELAAHYKVNPLTVAKVRCRAHERGVLPSLVRGEQQTRKARKLDGEQEAQLVTVVCSTPPEGAARWSLRLIRERLLELEVVEHIGLETIRTTLKKTRLNRG